MIPMFSKNKEGVESGGDLPDETRILGEYLDGTFVSCVEEDGAAVLPIGVIP